MELFVWCPFMIVMVEYSLLLHAFKSVTAEGAVPVFLLLPSIYTSKLQMISASRRLWYSSCYVAMLLYSSCHFLQELFSSCWSSITLQPKLDNNIKFSDVYAIELLDKGPICGPWNTKTAIQGKKNIEVMAFLLVNTRSIFCSVHQTFLPTNIR